MLREEEIKEIGRCSIREMTPPFECLGPMNASWQQVAWFRTY
jgi:hypothetical protein